MAGNAKQATILFSPFAKQTLKCFPHHILLASVSKLRNDNISRVIGSIESRKLERSSLQDYPQDYVTAYKKITSTTKLWHGTGRLQYRSDGVVDVLESIIDNRAICPAPDVYGILVGRGAMTTISTTPLRMVARCYADTHGRGVYEVSRYGDSLYWAAYFYSLVYAKLFTVYSFTVAKNWRSWKQKASNGSEITWGHKVNRSVKGYWDVFSVGSDIPGNYPIVFGIRSCNGQVRMPYAGKHIEVRVAEPIELRDLTHIEVPEQKIEEVRKIFLSAGVQLPVFSIELGEFVASLKDHHQLVGR